MRTPTGVSHDHCTNEAAMKSLPRICRQSSTAAIRRPPMKARPSNHRDEPVRPDIMNITKRCGRAVITVTLVVCAVAGCESAGKTAPIALPDVASSTPTSPLPTIQLAPREDAVLHLWVSNQSFMDDPVGVKIRIDGIKIIDQPFTVGNQHNWTLFPINVPRGQHTLSAMSDTGAELEQTFTLPARGRRYAVLDYWSQQDRDGRHFTWHIQNSPVGFM